MTYYMIAVLLAFFLASYWGVQSLISDNERAFLLARIPYLDENWEQATNGIYNTPLGKHVWRRMTFRNPWYVYPAATQLHANRVFKHPEANP